MTTVIALLFRAIGVLLGGAAVAGGFLAWTRRNVSRLPLPRRRRPELPPSEPEPEEGADLLAYPRKLEALEDALELRHRAVQDQLQLVHERALEISVKAGREELLRRYAEDEALLKRRAEGMRRVLGLVWKTRSILLLRVHLAITARRRPTFPPLPAAGELPQELHQAASRYKEAADAARHYAEEVEDRSRSLGDTSPSAPLSADVDEAIRAAVQAEHQQVAGAYTHLREQMDHLADNFTWLADHLSTLVVVTDPAADGAAPPPADGTARLLVEVQEALGEIAELARLVDPNHADSAVEHLAANITRLEVDGREAEAAAAAELEIDQMLRRGP